MFFCSKPFCLIAALSPLWLASQALAFDADQCRSIQFGNGVPPDAEYNAPDDFLVEPGGTGNELDCFIFTNSGGDFELSVIEPFPRDVLLRLQYSSGEVSLLYPRENGGLTAITGCFADVLPEVPYRCRAYLTTTNGDPEFVQDLDETFATIESQIEGSLRLLLEDEQRDAFWSTAGDGRTLEMVVDGREGAAPLEADPETQSYETRDIIDII